jgi:replicative DNA helicase
MSIDLEKNVLGSFLLSPESDIIHLCLKLEEDDFLDQRNKKMITLIKKVYTEGKPIDTVSIEAENPEIDGYSHHLYESVISSANIKHHVGLLIKNRINRELVAHAADFINDIQNGTDSHEALGKFTGSVTSKNLDTNVKSYKQLAKEFVPDFEKRFSSDYDHILKTGINALDRKVYIQNGDLVIVAARPSNGKTTLALNINESIGKENSTLFITMEMKDKQLFEKTLSKYSRVNYNKIQQPKGMTRMAILDITENIKKAADLKITVLESYNMTVDKIRSECEIICAQKDIKLICIDYLQLIEDSSGFKNKNDNTAEKTRKLKAMAIKLGIPIILLCQLNRQATNRADKKPILSDLRDSGAIEADADKVIFIHRPYVECGGTDPRDTDIIVAKNRGGETPEFKMDFIGAFQEFREVDYGTDNEETTR